MFADFIIAIIAIVAIAAALVYKSDDIEEWSNSVRYEQIRWKK